jgi:hypothetical protein
MTVDHFPRVSHGFPMAFPHLVCVPRVFSKRKVEHPPFIVDVPIQSSFIGTIRDL